MEGVGKNCQIDVDSMVTKNSVESVDTKHLQLVGKFLKRYRSPIKCVIFQAITIDYGNLRSLCPKPRHAKTLPRGFYLQRWFLDSRCQCSWMVGASRKAFTWTALCVSTLDAKEITQKSYPRLCRSLRISAERFRKKTVGWQQYNPDDVFTKEVRVLAMSNQWLRWCWV